MLSFAISRQFDVFSILEFFLKMAFFLIEIPA